MRTTITTLALALLLIAIPAGASGQEAGVVGLEEIDAALEEHHAAEDARREAVRRVVRTPEVREVARSMGVDPDQLEQAAGIVGGERLAAAAEQARAIESQLAGGQAITISATTITIILLLVIIVILVAN